VNKPCGTMSPFNIPPLKLDDGFSAGIVRGQLLHSWLENQVLNTKQDKIDRVREGERWETPGKFMPRVKQAIRLAENLVDCYSPRQLVYRLSALSSLSDGQKGRLGAALHEIYCSTCGVEDLARRLKESAEAVKESLREFLECLSAEDRREVPSSWERFRANAERLYAALQEVPKGVVIPCP